MKKKIKVFSVLAVILLAAIYYYIYLPAINIHAAGFWVFFIVVALLVAASFAMRKVKKTGDIRSPLDFSEAKKDKRVKISLAVAAAFIVIFLVGSILSSPIINASKYQQLLNVQTGDFAEDVEQISYNQIPLLDRESATILGNRKMGSLVDLTSQFVVSDLYSQINYHGKPVRVSPLSYASLIKWFTNAGDGIPAYIRIDMATQDTELVRLDEGMKYTPFDHFQRNLYRHLRFQYPTYIFDNVSFEIDEEGTPFWVCSVKKFNIGLFGGQTIGRVVLCNAVTGECEDYAVEDTPSWIDRVYSADLLVSLYDYYGTLKHGFINSVFGQRDCLQTTNGYNYLAINDDVWVYTGVTSVTSDQSNVGFVLMNQRTMESRYYQVSGAIEDSAMSSAEGQVQHLGYDATFPLLLNIAGEPTYFIALKDEAGLVKMYAMVNVEKYQIVATGDSVTECQKNYMALMKENGISASASDEGAKQVTGKIAKLFDAVVEGNSHCYVILEESDQIYDVSVADNIAIVRYEVGDTITLEYTEDGEAATVLGIQ